MENVLEEANTVTEDKRENEYGEGDTCFEMIAWLWDSYLAAKEKVLPEDAPKVERRDVAHMMILMKIARELMGHKRDNYVDIAGYARCASRMCGDEFVDEVIEIGKASRSVNQMMMSLIDQTDDVRKEGEIRTEGDVLGAMEDVLGPMDFGDKLRKFLLRVSGKKIDEPEEYIYFETDGEKYRVEKSRVSECEYQNTGLECDECPGLIDGECHWVKGRWCDYEIPEGVEKVTLEERFNDFLEGRLRTGRHDGVIVPPEFVKEEIFAFGWSEPDRCAALPNICDRVKGHTGPHVNTENYIEHEGEKVVLKIIWPQGDVPKDGPLPVLCDDWEWRLEHIYGKDLKLVYYKGETVMVHDAPLAFAPDFDNSHDAPTLKYFEEIPTDSMPTEDYFWIHNSDEANVVSLLEGKGDD